MIDFELGITVQRKYNGVHYVVFQDNSSQIIRYSRNGLIYPESSSPYLTINNGIIAIDRRIRFLNKFI